MLTRCRDSLTAIAEKLLEKEVLYEKEFMAMVPVDQLPDSKRDLEK